jgi:hypothetical protein
MAVFIGGIGAAKSSDRKVIKFIESEIPLRSGGLWNTPYRGYQDEDNWKAYVVYRKVNGDWVRKGSTYGRNPKAIVHFIREVMIQEGDYLFNTGKDSRTDYIYYHDGKTGY